MPLTDLLPEREKLELAELKSRGYSDTHLTKAFSVSRARLDALKLYLLDCVASSPALQEGEDISAAGFRSLVHIHFKAIAQAFPDICRSSSVHASVYRDYWEWVVKNLIREEKLKRTSLTKGRHLQKICSVQELEDELRRNVDVEDVQTVHSTSEQWKKKAVHLIDATAQKPIVRTETVRTIATFSDSTGDPASLLWRGVLVWLYRVGLSQRPLLYHYHDLSSAEVEALDALCIVNDEFSFYRICSIHFAQDNHIEFFVTSKEHMQSYLVSKAATLLTTKQDVNHLPESVAELQASQQRMLNNGMDSLSVDQSAESAFGDAAQLTLEEELRELRQQVLQLQEQERHSATKLRTVQSENEALRKVLRRQEDELKASGLNAK